MTALCYNGSNQGEEKMQDTVFKFSVPGYEITASEVDRDWILEGKPWGVYKDSRSLKRDKNCNLIYIKKYPNRNLAREVAIKIQGSLETDERVWHKDGDPLNVSRSNLEILTRRKLNQRRNMGKTSSKYIGVCWNTNKKRYIASLTLKGKSLYVGSYKDEEKAALAWNLAAKEKYGADSYYNYTSLCDFELPEGASFFPQ